MYDFIAIPQNLPEILFMYGLRTTYAYHLRTTFYPFRCLTFASVIKAPVVFHHRLHGFN